MVKSEMSDNCENLSNCCTNLCENGQNRCDLMDNASSPDIDVVQDTEHNNLNEKGEGDIMISEKLEPKFPFRPFARMATGHDRAPITSGLLNPGFPLMDPNVQKSLVEAYAARLQSEADYARYKACKESAETLYARLATLSALQSYGFYLPSLMAAAAASHLATPSQQQHPQQHLSLRAPDFNPGFDLSSTPEEGFSGHKDISNGKVQNRKRIHSSPRTSGDESTGSPVKKIRASGALSSRRKVARRLPFDEDKSSPVSGTLIRELADGEEIPPIHKGDIDPEFNVVEVTDEAKAELAKIENKIGDYVCQLCKEIYDDAFGLAQHRCSMIVHVEYRCPECDKVFNCPANLASHRRWHKPRMANLHIKAATAGTASLHGEENNNNSNNIKEGRNYSCDLCQKLFRKHHSLRKHLVQFHNLVDVAGSPSTAARSAPSASSSSCSPTSTASSTSSYSIADLLSPKKKHGISELICHVCNLSFGSSADLDYHRMSQHSETFPCSWCQEIFHSLAGLNRHVNRFHAPGMPASWGNALSPPPLVPMPGPSWQMPLAAITQVKD